MLNPLSVTLLPSGQVTTSGVGVGVDGAASAVLGGAVGQARQLAAVVVDISAAAAGSLRLFIESSDNGTAWEDSSGGSMLVEKVEVIRCSVYGLRRFVRVRYESSGADVTLTVSAKLHQTYATPEDFRAKSVLGKLDTDEDILWQTLSSASQTAAGLLAVSMTLPLLAWGDDLRGPVCNIAQYELSGTVGQDPSNSDNDTIDVRYQDAMLTLQGVSRGTRVLVATQDQTPDIDEGGIAVCSEPLRGW